nr:unnamed protein product [Digitaria exilis]
MAPIVTRTTRTPDLHPHLFIHRCPISIHPPPPPMAPSEGRRPGYAPVFQGIILI